MTLAQFSVACETSVIPLSDLTVLSSLHILLLSITEMLRLIEVKFDQFVRSKFP